MGYSATYSCASVNLNSTYVKEVIVYLNSAINTIPLVKTSWERLFLSLLCYKVQSYSRDST